MNLPSLDSPERYRGLYVFDFGPWTAVGYTADEIAMLLESERYAAGKVYKIHNAAPDGSMELRGVSNVRFQLESGLCFYRSAPGRARADYAELLRLVEQTPPPCRAVVHLAELTGGDGWQHVTALLYPAEYEDEIGRWLLDVGYQGGDMVEGGPSVVTGYQDAAKRILERHQLWSREHVASRSREEVYASVRRAVQR